VNIGVEAFLPASQIDVLTPKNLAQYVGNTYDFKVVKINQERQNIVLSRRELIEQERTERRQKLLSEMTPGDIRKGTVKNITDFGAFIDLNGIDGLLHITDMSWGRVGHPSEILKVGQDIDVVVLDINREKERISLGLKQKLANPWDTIEQKYPVGAKVKGRVVNLVPYGAFVELEPGVEGLVHVTELSWTKRVAKPSDMLKPDQEIEAVVLGINREEQKISLGLRQLEANPWDKAMDKYPAGTHVKGKIRNLTSYGAFIELEEGLDGMIHVSDMSWTRKINHPSEVLKKGDDIEAIVLEVDKTNQRIAVGMKQLTPDPWEGIDQLYKVGDLVTGKVTKLASFGAFIGLQHDIDGLVHISQISEERIDKIKNVLKVDQEVTARVIKIDKSDRRIGLSIKAANYSSDQLKAEQAALDALKPGEDLVALQHAFDAADEAKQDETK
jgi:small subunit ribosomal protein S1